MRVKCFSAALLSILAAHFAGAQTATQPLDPRMLPWVGCYEIAVEDSAGRPPRVYGTVSIDTMPAAGQRNRRSGTYLSGGPPPNHRTAWRLTVGDTLDVSSVFVDGGYRFMLLRGAADSLRGTFEMVGMGADPANTKRAVARRLPTCTRR